MVGDSGLELCHLFSDTLACVVGARMLLVKILNIRVSPLYYLNIRVLPFESLFSFTLTLTLVDLRPAPA